MMADGYGLQLFPQQAGLLAKELVVAYPPTDAGEGVLFAYLGEGGLKVPVAEQGN
jgi:hypothetical protein